MKKMAWCVAWSAQNERYVLSGRLMELWVTVTAGRECYIDGLYMSTDVLDLVSHGGSN